MTFSCLLCELAIAVGALHAVIILRGSLRKMVTFK